MKNKILFSIATVFIASLLSFAVLTYAYKGDSNVKGPNYNSEIHEELTKAIQNGDYDAWIKIRQDNNLPMNGKMFQVINKENFKLYAQLHNANIAGDLEKVNAIKSELGLGQKSLYGSGKGKKHNSNLGHGINCVKI